ncbi:hypothetical protein MNBD_BACTEROID01-1037 [hydrothermal vent metagenome]|uniref:Outer membrane protein beta-barrel domain-containing protein n=1 Tax=hydrothermal vent metagenome TaxID=652676 RepID=A0A3B0TVR0_9ZZZZ
MIAVSVSGQAKKGHIFLKNGSIIKGKILESAPEGKIHVYSAGNTWVFQKSEIEKLVYNNKSGRGIKNDTLTSKFSVHTEAGVLIGNSENSQTAPLIFQTSVNYALTRKLNVGIGAGPEFLKETYIPVFANFEYKFREGDFTPYLFLQAGYSIPVENATAMQPDIYPYYSRFSSIRPDPWYNSGDNLKTKGGLMANTGVGVVKMFSPYFGITFSFGYRFSRLSYSGEDNYGIDLDYNRLSLKLGIIFN